MGMPLQITFRNTPVSPSVEETIVDETERLFHLNPRITFCRVVVEAPQKRGLPFRARIDLNIPGTELVVTKDSHFDVYVAVRDAFDAMVRELTSYTHRHTARRESILDHLDDVA